MLESIEMPCSWQITKLTIMPSEHMNVVSSAPSQGSFNKNILQFLNPYLGVLGGPVGGQTSESISENWKIHYFLL